MKSAFRTPQEQHTMVWISVSMCVTAE